MLNVSAHGIWLLVRGEEFLLGYADHPWFRKAPIEKILDVELLHDKHLRWPQLDVDLHVDSLRDHARFPLKSRL